MGKLNNKIHILLDTLEIGNAEKSFYKERANKYSKECGCSMGGIFLAVASVLTVFYLCFINFSIPLLLKAIIFLFVFSVTGKIAGILMGRIRLLLLFRYIKQQALPLTAA